MAQIRKILRPSSDSRSDPIEIPLDAPKPAPEPQEGRKAEAKLPSASETSTRGGRRTAKISFMGAPPLVNEGVVSLDLETTINQYKDDWMKRLCEDKQIASFISAPVEINGRQIPWAIRMLTPKALQRLPRRVLKRLASEAIEIRRIELRRDGHRFQYRVFIAPEDLTFPVPGGGEYRARAGRRGYSDIRHRRKPKSYKLSLPLEELALDLAKQAGIFDPNDYVDDYEYEYEPEYEAEGLPEAIGKVPEAEPEEGREREEKLLPNFLVNRIFLVGLKAIRSNPSLGWDLQLPDPSRFVGWLPARAIRLSDVEVERIESVREDEETDSDVFRRIFRAGLAWMQERLSEREGS